MASWRNVPYCTVPYRTVLYCTVLYRTVQYSSLKMLPLYSSYMARKEGNCRFNTLSPLKPPLRLEAYGSWTCVMDLGIQLSDLHVCLIRVNSGTQELRNSGTQELSRGPQRVPASPPLARCSVM